MKKTELESEFSQLKNSETCIIGDIKEKEHQDKFKYQGVYILVDPQSQEVVYVGSAYVRYVRKRLLQYQQYKSTGNKNLYLDLIENGVTTEENAESYIKSLIVYAFPDQSLEYQMINKIDKLANKVGINSEKDDE